MSTRNLVKSFQYALQGLIYTLATQRNMRIHFTIALCVMLLSLVLGVNRWEALLVFIAITLVMIAELFNTAIETLVDMATEEFHPLAKVAKDVAAGAVFLTAGLSIAIGMTVFVPYVYALVHQTLVTEFYNPDITAVFILGVVLFGTIALKAWARYQTWHSSPSLTTAVAVSIVLLVWGMTLHLTVSLLVTVLSLLLVGSKLMTQSDWRSVLWGAVVGGAVTIGGFLLT
ncbi:MAG: diacylglycerol kinase family protein [Novibacillus thermophilus]